MTNFIFSRRDIQQRINRLSSTVTADQLEVMVAKLNTPGRNRLPTMWEVLVLDALAQEGALRHELPLSSGSKPDFELTYQSSGGHALLVIGDVLTVSDTGLKELNPVDVLFEQTPAIANKHGVDPNRISYKIDGQQVGRHGDARMQLGLPKRGELIALLNGEVSGWLRKVGRNPDSPSQFQPSQEGLTFTISYDPTGRSRSGSYLSYDVAASREKNPLYKALRDKKIQLEGASEDAIKLLIACDGGCAVLRSNTSSFRAPGTYNASQIADHFLNKHSGIDAILLITVEEQRSPFDPKTSRRLRFDLRVDAETAPAQPLPLVYRLLDELARKSIHHFPAPQRVPYNAIRRCQEPGLGHSQMGVYRMADKGLKGRTVSISARGLLELLSGRISSEQFKQAHRWDSAMPGWNPFANALAEGRMIADVKIEAMDDLDDDWLTLEFGEVDAAVAPFSTPSTDTKLQHQE